MTARAALAAGPRRCYYLGVGPRLALLLIVALLCRASPVLFGGGAMPSLASWSLTDGRPGERGPTWQAPVAPDAERVIESEGAPRVFDPERAGPRHAPKPRAAPPQGRVSFGHAILYARRGIGCVPPRIDSADPPDRRAMIRRHRVASDVPRGAHPPSDDPARRLG